MSADIVRWLGGTPYDRAVNACDRTSLRQANCRVREQLLYSKVCVSRTIVHGLQYLVCGPRGVFLTRFARTEIEVPRLASILLLYFSTPPLNGQRFGVHTTPGMSSITHGKVG